jgi:hypothetical protein
MIRPKISDYLPNGIRRKERKKKNQYIYCTGIKKILFDLWLTVHRNSMWIRKTN